jgi:hypothetical protein
VYKKIASPESSSPVLSPMPSPIISPTPIEPNIDDAECNNLYLDPATPGSKFLNIAFNCCSCSIHRNMTSRSGLMVLDELDDAEDTLSSAASTSTSTSTPVASVAAAAAIIDTDDIIDRYMNMDRSHSTHYQYTAYHQYRARCRNEREHELFTSSK